MNNHTTENMAINKILLLLVLTFSTALYTDQDASAHVLIRDRSGTVGAVLHITPGDDPVAGMSSTISLSIDNTSLNGNNSKLVVKNVATGFTEDLKYTQNNGALTAQYIFPSQGTYELTIQAQASGTKKYNFAYTQRVSKGVGFSAETSTYPLARFAFISTCVLYLLTIIVVVKKKKEITIQSTF